jgi:electron transfer flavoprotein alpha subunit
VSGVSRVLLVEADSLEHNIAENSSAMLFSLLKAEPHGHIVGSTSSATKAMFPRLGVLMDTAPIAEVVDIKTPDTFVRPIYAGNAIATVQSADDVKILSVRPTSFAPAAEGGSAEVVSMSPEFSESSTRWIKNDLTSSDRPALASAKVVISGGRGMQNKENFGLLEQLADKLGGAVGASRAAVDAGYAPNDMQVGQTGKVVAPELYMALAYLELFSTLLG